MTITKVNCPANKVAIKCPYTQTPELIVVHNTFGTSSAMSEVSYMLGNDKYVSFHYAVDNERAVQGIDENRCAWHSGNYPINLKSIGIEICYSKNGGEIFEQSENNAAELIADILKRYGWGIDKVRYHKEFANTSCPHKTLELGWERFLNKVRAKLNVAPAPTPAPSTPAPQAVKYSAGSYKVIASNGVNVRPEPNTNKKPVATIGFGSMQGIDRTEGSWGHLSNNAGWICLDYCSKTDAPTPTPNVKGYVLGRYKVNTTDGLRVRTGPSVDNPRIKTYPNGTIFDTYQISGNWAKTPSRICMP